MGFHFTATEIALIGATSGPISLILGIFNALGNRVKLIVEEADLSFVNNPDGYRNKSVEQLKRYSLQIRVDFGMSNRRAGTGSFERPRLRIRLDNKHIIVKPSYHNRDKSFSINPHGRVDDVLIYELFAKDIKLFVNNMESAEYFLIYRDHKGKEKYYKINNVKQWV
jgi:hypothetical protein